MLAGDEAAETYIKLADVHIKLDSKSEAASSWVEASKAYQKAGSPGADRWALRSDGKADETTGKLDRSANHIYG